MACRCQGQHAIGALDVSRVSWTTLGVAAAAVAALMVAARVALGAEAKSTARRRRARA